VNEQLKNFQEFLLMLRRANIVNNEKRPAETGPFGRSGRVPRTPVPWETMEVVIKRAKNACESCGTGIKKLTAHHLSYDLMDVTHNPEDAGKLIFGSETPEVLRLLCNRCHEKEHFGPDGEFNL
jgi:hypothetical protein